MIGTPLLAPSQIRAARALLNWTQEQLADKAGVGVGTIRDYENERRGNVVGAMRDIEHALNGGGVAFLHATAEAGAGVRLLGKVPDVLRWPTKRGPSGELTIKVQWKGAPFEVFLSEDTLEDLAGLGHEPNSETYLNVIEQQRTGILRAAAVKIDSGNWTPDRRVHLSEPNIQEAFHIKG